MEAFSFAVLATANAVIGLSLLIWAHKGD